MRMRASPFPTAIALTARGLRRKKATGARKPMAYDLPPAVERPKRRRPNREQRQHLEERAFRLRLEGWTTRQIADEPKISVAATWRHYTNAREKVAQHLDRGGSAALTMELCRLDAQAQALWPLAMGHKETRLVDGKPVQVDVPPDVEAHHALLAINKARRAMLGLDVPKEVAVRAHVAQETCTLLWGFDLQTHFPDPPALPGPLVEVQGGNGAPVAAGSGNGARGANGNDNDPWHAPPPQARALPACAPGLTLPLARPIRRA